MQLKPGHVLLEELRDVLYCSGVQLKPEHVLHEELRDVLYCIGTAMGPAEELSDPMYCTTTLCTACNDEPGEALL